MQSFIKATLGCIRDKTGSIFCLSGTRIKPPKNEFSESWTNFSLFFALFARVDNFLNVKYAEKTSRYCSNHFSNLYHTTGTYLHICYIEHYFLLCQKRMYLSPNYSLKAVSASQLGQSKQI